ncbi:hypothetical protein [Ectobacillus ponti]|uniref:Uncharacterized protein n=1 Tax=Ectobacillus ponti TaxID=2961894 RepID=A0AA41XC38_9BACI|nr:hypothetical protein [Ectobacillus ponti]MCP8970700.1 hypothetical protein [Ectobacillus ponti]
MKQQGFLQELFTYIKYFSFVFIPLALLAEGLHLWLRMEWLQYRKLLPFLALAAIAFATWRELQDKKERKASGE